MRGVERDAIGARLRRRLGQRGGWRLQSREAIDAQLTVDGLRREFARSVELQAHGPSLQIECERHPAHRNRRRQGHQRCNHERRYEWHLPVAFWSRRTFGQGGVEQVQSLLQFTQFAQRRIGLCSALRQLTGRSNAQRTQGRDVRFRHRPAPAR